VQQKVISGKLEDFHKTLEQYLKDDEWRVIHLTSTYAPVGVFVVAVIQKYDGRLH